MRPYPPCGQCGAPVKFRDRDLCHACRRRAAREALKRPCPGCGRIRDLRSAGICAICDRPAGPMGQTLAVLDRVVTWVSGLVSPEWDPVRIRAEIFR
jgi:hypothetical protein